MAVMRYKGNRCRVFDDAKDVPAGWFDQPTIHPHDSGEQPVQEFGPIEEEPVVEAPPEPEPEPVQEEIIVSKPARKTRAKT
mgnify:CR=1 FL=1